MYYNYLCIVWLSFRIGKRLGFFGRGPEILKKARQEQQQPPQQQQQPLQQQQQQEEGKPKAFYGSNNFSNDGSFLDQFYKMQGMKGLFASDS